MSNISLRYLAALLWYFQVLMFLFHVPESYHFGVWSGGIAWSRGFSLVAFWVGFCVMKAGLIPLSTTFVKETVGVIYRYNKYFLYTHANISSSNIHSLFATTSNFCLYRSVGRETVRHYICCGCTWTARTDVPPRKCKAKNSTIYWCS